MDSESESNLYDKKYVETEQDSCNEHPSESKQDIDKDHVEPIANQDNFMDVYTEMWLSLHKEIDDLYHQLSGMNKNVDTKQNQDVIEEYTRKISDVLQVFSAKRLDTRKQIINPATGQQFHSPIYALLSIAHNKGSVIPLDILKRLISAGFDVNDYDNAPSGVGTTCLYWAIHYSQYDAVRLLVTHGATCDHKFYWRAKLFSRNVLAMVLLAEKSDVPLDLFDLYASKCQNVQDELVDPLCAALSYQHTKIALHLLKLGASVDTVNQSSRLPISSVLVSEATASNYDLFMKLLPSKPKGVDILKPICGVLSMKCSTKTQEMLHQLIQRLIFEQPLRMKIDISYYRTLRLIINDDYIVTDEHKHKSSELVYLCSVILCELNFDAVFSPSALPPKEQTTARFEGRDFREAVDDLWRAYHKHQQHNVKSLARLCILQIRNTMCRLDDNSFLTLPVPFWLRRMLTYRDVSEKVYEQWAETKR